MYTAGYLWHPKTSRNENIYVAFQAEISTKQKDSFSIIMFGNNSYRAYIDGKEIIEGPARFEINHPEFDEHRIELNTGNHLIMVFVHYYGVSTRFSVEDIPPFFQCVMESSQGIVPLIWKCKEIDAFAHLHRRVNGQIGWMEVCDTRLLPDLSVINTGRDWLDPIEVNVQLGSYHPKSIADCMTIPVKGALISQGTYTNLFGYVDDDPPVRFMLRNLNPSLPPEGVWFRIDLGLIGLYRPLISIEAPTGSIVEAGYSETLNEGRVQPVITLSASTSCHMDRWITSGGRQELQTFSPRGFRYLEIHISAPANKVRLIDVSGLQRTYFAEPTGSFHCNDSLLNDIWKMSVNTLRACSEDALTDTPTRERGQWLGDAVAVGMETTSVSFNDLRLIRRSLVQAAYCRREDGLAAGLYPGQNMYVSSFALLWVSGCLRYFHHTGDRALLLELHETAVKTMRVILSMLSPRGVHDLDVWDFIDWGHMIEEEEVNVAFNLLVLGALRDLQTWEQELGIELDFPERKKQWVSFEEMILKTYSTQEGQLAHSVPAEGPIESNGLRLGYHATILGLRLHLFDPAARPKAIDFVKRHIMDCFPNHLEAPRLSDPGANHNRLITPYFSHFSLQVLWEAGEVDFVLDQYRTCWGWMLEQGATTLLEVFDPRWSHCHAWSGCPAWQLSRHVLGLGPDATGNPEGFIWFPKPGHLQYAEGILPFINRTGGIEIKWVKQGASWIYTLHSDKPIMIHLEKYWEIESVEVDGIKVDTRIDDMYIQRRMSLTFTEKVMISCKQK